MRALSIDCKKDYVLGYSPKWLKMVTRGEECWINYVFVFFVHNKYSRSFVKLWLNHWCHMDYFTNVLATFLDPVALLSTEGQRALRFYFYPKYLNLCSEDERRPYGFAESTWKPYLSKSTETLQWKLLHYTLQVTNSKTTWVEYLILTVLKYFTYTKYRLKDALVKETFQSKTVTLWRSWGKQAEARIYVQAFHGKTRTNNKPKTKGDKEQNDGQTDNHYIQHTHKELKKH